MSSFPLDRHGLTTNNHYDIPLSRALALVHERDEWRRSEQGYVDDVFFECVRIVEAKFEKYDADGTFRALYFRYLPTLAISLSGVAVCNR